MKCPKCEKQNKPGVKNCEYCNELMPVRKKKASTVKKNDTTKKKSTPENKTEEKKEAKIVHKESVKKNSKPKKKIEKQIEEKKEPIIELSDEKKALKKLLKNIKKIRKIIYLYILLVIVILLIILGINEKMHTITCEISNNSEMEKYNIKLVLKKDKYNNITGFKYITENTTNSYDETLKSRYDIIIEELQKKDDYDKIVTSFLKTRSWKIVYDFKEDYLKETIDYIGIDLTPYLDNVNAFVEEIENEVGFTCK